ncbi:NPFFR2 [Mytilus coruscus]|uniref:NPFFR2 n=1 Tax=Mytilus coruscus TaxID=42192 RepID=A0A6J8DHV3_MYTCO|nr:NPFFR2 [Mytilus coruscus]
MAPEKKEDFDNALVITIFLLIWMVGIVISNGTVAGILILRKRLRNIPNLYIVALSFSQLFIGTFVILSTIFGVNFISTPTAWCITTPFFELFAFSAGIFYLVGLTVDRDRAILHPISYKPTIQKTVAVLVMLTVGALVYSVQIFIQYGISKSVNSENNDKINSYNESNYESSNMCNILTEDESSDLWFRIVDFVLLFMIPVIAMVIMYYRIIKTLWSPTILTTSSTIRKRKVIRSSVVCVTSFLICWLPFYVLDIIHDSIEIITGDEVSGKSYDVARIVVVFLALSNSLINPIIYGFLNKQFQREMCVIKNKYFCKGNQIADTNINTHSHLGIFNNQGCSSQQTSLPV